MSDILGCDLLLYRLSHRRKSIIRGLTMARGCLFGFVHKKTTHAREINAEKSSQRCQISQVTQGAHCPIRSFPPISYLAPF